MTKSRAFNFWVAITFSSCFVSPFEVFSRANLKQKNEKEDEGFTWSALSTMFDLRENPKGKVENGEEEQSDSNISCMRFLGLWNEWVGIKELWVQVVESNCPSSNPDYPPISIKLL